MMNLSISDLPVINASLNGLSALCLFAGFIMIKQGRQKAHRNCMISAFVVSTIFLACYLTYHFKSEVLTRFVEPAWFRPYYLVILLTHTVLAVVIVPLIFMSMSRGLRGRNEAHKKISRWTLPLWMYVSITGVVIYLILYQIFPQKPTPKKRDEGAAMAAVSLRSLN